YNATHGLPYENKVHGPLTQRDLQTRQAYTGDATYFNAGLGACGGTNGNSEHVVALNVPTNICTLQQWNGGANCWRGITIQAYGKQVNAAIVDQCPGCGYGSLDLTPSLFEVFTDLSVGRFGITWWYRKAFKEKKTPFDADAKSPTLVDTRPSSSDVSRPSREIEKPLPPTPKKPAPTPTKKRNGGGNTSSDTNAYLVPGMNPAINPIYFPTPVVDSGPSYGGGCDSSGGGGGYSGGSDSGGGYSGGCDSGGGFSSSSF
ncbi:hypothetical protein FRC11_013762, partial [Ceratobasidium sp. 423]